MDPISGDDHTSISHINFVTNKSHDLVNELYEDLMERDIVILELSCPSEILLTISLSTAKALGEKIKNIINNVEVNFFIVV